MEHTRPQRLAAKVQDGGEMSMRGLRRIAVSWREKRTQENVPIGGAAGEFLGGVGAGADL